MLVRQDGDTSEAIRAAVAQALSPVNRRFIVTAAAREAQIAAEAAYRKEFGREPTTTITIDGRAATALVNLDPDHGDVAFRFQRATEALAWIYEQIVKHSPVLTGRYAAAHVMLADGVEADPSNPSRAERYVFVNLTPYGKKIEQGQSRSAPGGVYQAVAALANRRFGNSVHVGFGYESAVLDYIAGARGRGARAALRRQPTRVAAMRLERRTRAPVIVVTLS